MAAYSPISSHRHRVNTAPPYQISATLSQTAPAVAPSTAAGAPPGHATTGSRRRESMNSSIGATSIRRLLAVNRGCRHKVPVHVRAKVAKNFTLLIVAHGLACAVLVPLFGFQVKSVHSEKIEIKSLVVTYSNRADTLTPITRFVNVQASNSMWFHQESWLLRMIGPNVGPLLISVCYLITSGMCLLTNRIVKKIDFVTLIALHYATLCLFLLAHLYPAVWLLLPVYAMLGVTLGPAWICKWNLVVFFASRISCGLQECSNITTLQSDVGGTAANAVADEVKGFCNRNQRIRRLARCFHAMQDVGFCIGAIAASVIISCAASDSGCFFTSRFFNLEGANNSFSAVGPRNASPSAYSTKKMPYNTNQNAVDSLNTLPTNYENLNEDPVFAQHDELQDSLYNTNEHGARICGAGSCPTWNEEMFNRNETEEYSWFTYNGTIPMTVFYLLFAVMALILGCLSQQVDNTTKMENYKGVIDTLLFAGPLAYFIGTEQAYVLGGFTRVSTLRPLVARLRPKIKKKSKWPRNSPFFALQSSNNLKSFPLRFSVLALSSPLLSCFFCNFSVRFGSI